MLFFISFFIISTASALDWSSSGHGFHTGAETLQRNQSAFLISAQGRELGHRLSGSGEREQIFVNKEPQTPTKNANSDQINNVRLTQIRTTLLWVHGLTSSWTMGALLPITNTKMQTKDNISRVEQESSDTRIGNVELVSKENLHTTARTKFSLSQNLKFPSAQSNEEELGLLPSPEPNGFGLGAGAIYNAYLFSRFSSSLAANYEMNLPDKIKNADVTKTRYVSRDPGDLFTVGMYSEYQAIDEASFMFNLIHSQKASDKLNNESYFFQEKGSEQSGAEVGLKFETHDRSYFAQNYALQLKYYSTLSGRNIQDEDSLSFQMQIVY